MPTYRVCIVYREPTFERQNQWGPRPYRAAFIVQARTGELAAERARNAFDVLASRSHVSWIREVTGTLVEPLAEDSAERLDGAG